MRACACVALSGWQEKNSRQDNTMKYLGPVVYRKRVPERENNSPVHPATDLKAGLARVESFQLDQERRNASVHALAVTHADNGGNRARGGASDRGRDDKYFRKRHDGGRGRNHQQQQQQHLRQMHPGQQQRP